MQCHLIWDSYKKNICNGFSSLQQKEEFVDMTIAAEGHLVKVHRTLIALASPYIKEMLQSASCQHPVIFLNNVSNEVLCYILEYIYTGEVGLPVDKINTFIEAAKALRIIGLDCVVNPMSKRNEAPIPATTNLKKPMNRPVNNSFSKSSILRQLMVQNGLGNDDSLDKTADDRVHSEHNVVDTAGDMIHVGLQENLDYNSVIKPVSIRVDEGEITDIDTVHNIPYQQEKSYKLPSNLEIEPDNCNSSIPTFNFNQNVEALSGQVYNYNLEIQRMTDQTPNPISDINIQSNIDQLSTNNCNQFISTHNVITIGDTNIQTNLDQTFTTDNYNQIFSIPDDVNTIGDTNVQPNLEQTFINYDQTISVHNDVDMQPSEVQPPINQSVQDQSYPKIAISVDKLSAHHRNSELETEGSNNLPDIQGNSPLYALSNKGSMQLILNRYMYYLHHSAHGGRSRRWRCIDYRRQACKAFIDTDGEIIVQRKFEHCHPFHDSKILKKGHTGMMFTSIQEVSTVNEDKNSIDNQKKRRRLE